MIYRREEPFRFQFKTPLHGTFTIISVDGLGSDDNKKGAMEILDISPNGLKFATTLDLPIDHHKLVLETSFLINNSIIRMVGMPIWKKTRATSVLYGFRGVNNLETKREIIESLKEYVRNNIC